MAKGFALSIGATVLCESWERSAMFTVSKKMRAGVLLGVAGLALSASTASAELVYGVTLTGSLVSWDSAAPSAYLSARTITGLQPNEQVKGIDFRPATGEVFALGSFDRVYRVNTANAAMEFVGSFAPPNLRGSQFGWDFNPTVDRIRLVSDTEQNLRINPVTGGLAGGDTDLVYAAGDANFGINPNIVHAAYTNNFAGATTTTLYVIDSGRNSLAIQNPPNAGVLNTVAALNAGGLPIDIGAYGGFDISGAGTAYAALTLEGESVTRFFNVNLATGGVTGGSAIGGGEILVAMTVVPSPAGLGLALAGLPLLARRRR